MVNRHSFSYIWDSLLLPICIVHLQANILYMGKGGLIVVRMGKGMQVITIVLFTQKNVTVAQ